MLASVKVREAQKLIQEAQQLYSLTADGTLWSNGCYMAFRDFDDNQFDKLQRKLTQFAKEVRT